MLCEHCKQREANVRYTQIVNGVKKEMVLCDKCSKELGISNMGFNMPIDFSSFFGEFLNEYNDNFMPLLTKTKPLVCDKCKMTYEEFVNQGKFGCSNFYNVFADKIDPLLKRLHGSNRYVGRKSNKRINQETEIEKSKQEDVKNTENEEKLKKLKLEIKKKINEEKYEEAAKIRDEIKKLEENQ